MYRLLRGSRIICSLQLRLSLTSDLFPSGFLLTWRLEGKKQLGSPRIKWGNNIKMGLKEVGWLGVGWINLAQDTAIGGLLRTR